jgi:hypothetical protein
MNRLYCLLAASFLILVGCQKPNPRVATTVNQTAAAPGDLPWNPLQWNVITSAIDKQNSTMCAVGAAGGYALVWRKDTGRSEIRGICDGGG